jgi:diguanylate cyclase (GGDEF)-like protein/PAS domain S-box-containing protein
MSEFESPDVLRSVLESLQTGIYLVDRDHKIVFWSDGAERITGYLRQEVVGRFCRESLIANSEKSKNILSEAADALATALRDGKPASGEISFRHKSGHRIPVRMRAAPIRNSHGSVIGAVECFDESPSVSDWDRRQTKLADQGHLDQATGVANPTFLQACLLEILSNFIVTLVPFSLVSVQVDRLDHLRAAYGPGVIAPIQREVAQTLENSLRPTDLLGRFQDDQFLIILMQCGTAEIELVANRLRKMVSQTHVEWWGDDLSITASFGVTTVKPEDKLPMLLERAKNSLKQSLSAGGDRVTTRWDNDGDCLEAESRCS